MEIHEFVLEDSNDWDENLLETLLEPADVSRVLRTPLPPRGVLDKFVWCHARSGQYSVKRGYQLASRLCQDSSLEVPGEWNRIWRLKVPHRVKDCLWRICRNVLPTKVNLFQKRVVENKSCVFCGHFEETAWHIFVDCYYARECWHRLNLWANIDQAVWVVDGLRELVFAMLDSPESAVFGMQVWQIWKERNELVWNGMCRSSGEAVHASAVFWNAGRAAKESRSSVGHHLQNVGARAAVLCKAWHPPLPGVLKINVDAAFFEDTNQTGVGMVIRDEDKRFIMARSLVKSGRQEVMGFFEALSWIKTLDLGAVMVEGDSKIVIDALASSSRLHSVFGDYIYVCQEILNHNPLFGVSFVKHDANQMAHVFARVSRDYGPVHCWLDPPIFVDGLPLILCVCNNEN